MSDDVTLDEVCVTAIAEAFRGDGEILCNPIGIVPVCGGRLARESFEHDLMMTDTVSLLVKNTLPVGVSDAPKIIESNMPFRSIFDAVWSGRRHVVMGASQIDRYGNQNFAAIGAYQQPKVQLLGYRGAPGNTINDTTSYWVPNHSPTVLVPAVDTVCGVGYDRAAELGQHAARFHEVRFVVTNLAVLDFATPDNRMRIRSVHPGVSVDDVQTATGFELVIPDDVPTSRLPTPEELELIDSVIDPTGQRFAEVPRGT